MADPDTAFSLLYSVGRNDVQYIITFGGTEPNKDATRELFPVDATILDAYDRLAQRG